MSRALADALIALYHVHLAIADTPGVCGALLVMNVGSHEDESRWHEKVSVLSIERTDVVKQAQMGSCRRRCRGWSR